jgi:hypothetical protein
MQPSTHQATILDWLINGTGNGCCDAVAGSGKSTTLKMGALQLKESGYKPRDIKVIVFGKANSLNLIEKFGSEWKESISTLHSAGWTLLKEHLQLSGNIRNLIKSGKYKLIAQDQGFINRRGAKGTLKSDGAIDKEADFTKLVDLVRLTRAETTSESIVDICEHFEIAGVWKPKTIATAIALVLKIGEDMATIGESFDFTDQIWLPVKWKLAPRTPYKFVLVDECQDLNAAQLELCLQLAGSDGRLLFVGDPKQAIMGFAGADNRSYQKIVERTKATVLPLSICYRCPSEHIKLVKGIFPNIPLEPAPDALNGSIIQCEEKDLDTLLKVGDMVISRKTAPLVSLCIKLIAKGIKATVKGRDIGETIKKDLEAISETPGFSYEKFNEAVNQYRVSLFARYESLDNEEQLKESLNDKLDALSAIYRSQVNAKSIQDLEQYIDSLFSDETSPITLSTCHRAKGLEGKRIFLHRAEDMPMTWRSQLDWQFEQEMNLLYVALTRSKNELFVVGNPNWLKLDDKQVQAEKTTENIYSETSSVSQVTIEIAATAIIDDPLELSTKFLTPTELKQWVNIGSIVLDAGTQSRQQTNQVTVNDYLQQMIDGQWNWEFEPLPILFTDSDNYYPGDGHHRILAAMQVRGDIFAEVRPGTLRDAIFYSCQANRFHGLQRSRADKRNQVELILKDLEWQIMSDRAIAEHCGVSAPFVGNIRHELVEQGTVTATSQRTDKKGRLIETDSIGRKARVANLENLPPVDFRVVAAIEEVELRLDGEGISDVIEDIPDFAPVVIKPLPPANAVLGAKIDSLCSEIGAKSLAMLVLDRLSSAEKHEIYKYLV